MDNHQSRPGFRPRQVAVEAAQLVWRWRWLVFMNLYLISPVLAYEGRLRDKTVLFTLPASILGLLLIQIIGARRIWITHALLLPFYLTAGMDLFTIVNYQTRFSSNMIVLVVGNLEDAKGFLEADFFRTVGSLVLVLTAFVLCLYRIRHLRVTIPRSVATLPAVALIGVYVGVHHYFGAWSLVAMNDRTSPMGIFAQSYLTLQLRQEEMRLREQAKSFDFTAARKAAPEVPETYVLIVGESSRRQNFGLYGYGRDTTPQLSKDGNLVAFQDAITQVAQTQVSVPLILTRGSIDNLQRSAREKSIVTLFHDVGFRTYWLSSQQREIAMAAISHYTAEADVVRFFERQHDIVLVDAMRDILTKESPAAPKRFFLVHMLGSHFNLTSRYPREFARWPDGAEGGLVHGTSASSSNAELINAYDNTILYEDYVLGELFSLLRSTPGISAAFFVTDHGDNLRDDARNIFGHAHNNEYDLPVPLLFWYSDAYARQFPDKVAAARRNVPRPVTTRAVFYSVADMAAITFKDADEPRLSVLSPELANVKRLVGLPDPHDFDEWLARTGTRIPAARVPE